LDKDPDADLRTEALEASSPPNTALSPRAQRTVFLSQLDIYLRAMYPRCPPEMRNELLARAKRKGHYGRLSVVAGILTDNHVRHELTAYEWLLNINGRRKGLTREEARLVVAADVREVVDGWRHGSAQMDHGLRRVTNQFKCRRRTLRQRSQTLTEDEAKSAADQLLREENAALTDYLNTWLNARQLPVLDARGESQGRDTAR
jgi:hypothetical protein